MPKTCAVISCMNTNEDKTISLHGLPSDELISNQWKDFLIEANQDYAWKPYKQMYICSNHFHRKCLHKSETQKQTLVRGSVPTIVGDLATSPRNATAQVSQIPGFSVTLTTKQKGCTCGCCEKNASLQEEMESQEMELRLMREEIRHKDELLADLRLKLRVLQRKSLRHEVGSKKRKLDEDDEELINSEPSIESEGGKMEMSDPGQQLLAEMSYRFHQHNNAPYSDGIKEFAFQLHYYAPRAYKYVRSILTVLPHPTTFNRWTKNVQTKPGFIPHAFEYIKQRNLESPYQIHYALSVDEIHIRKQIIHTGDGFTGFVDNGDMAGSNDSTKIASAALFILATEINGHKKMPIGYILTNGLKADTLACAIRNSVLKMREVGARVISITFDGLRSNIKAAEILGACMEVCDPDFRPFIPDPNGEGDIPVLLDPSHMFKLLRNLFKDFGTLLDGSGKEIRWSHIEALHKLQEESGLRAANKLTTRHIDFKNQKMKTNLCVQTLSNSVAVALGVCRELVIPGFADTEALEEFISMLDKLFDYLNSTSSGIGCKAAVKPKDYDNVRNFFAICKTYLLSLSTKLPDGELIKLCDTTRSTPITGLVITMTSVEKLMQEYLLPANSHLKYLPLYKTMQDQIETFFSVIRARFGCNNNPNSFQLEHALKGIICMKTKSILTGNCIEQEEISTNISPLANVHCMMNDADQPLSIEEEHLDDEISFPDEVNFSSFINNIVAYIAGFVGRKLCSIVKCYKCIVKIAATSTEIPFIRNDSMLILARDRGGLFMPSHGLIMVCKIAEEVIRQKEAKGLAQLSKDQVSSLVVNECIDKGFDISLDCEVRLDTMDDTNHSVGLIRDIIALYLKVRFHYLAKRSTLALNPTTNRNVCTKLVHFKGN